MTRIEAGLPCPEGCDGCMGGEMPCAEDAPAEVKPMPKTTRAQPPLPEPEVALSWEVQGGPEAGSHGMEYVPLMLPGPRSHYAHDYAGALIVAAVQKAYMERADLHTMELRAKLALVDAYTLGATGVFRNLLAAIYNIAVWHASADDHMARRIKAHVYVDGGKIDIMSGQSRR